MNRENAGALHLWEIIWNPELDLEGTYHRANQME